MNAQDLKNSILQLAIQGKLVEQREEEGTAKELLKKIDAEKKQLIKEKAIKRQKNLPEITEEEIDFEIPPSWEWTRLEAITYSIGDKTNQIKQSEILQEGRYPVVSQSMNRIEGYSNEENKLLNIKSLSVIVFGDHSKTLKLIDFDFIIGADGTKIMVPIAINPEYLFYVLNYNTINMRDRGYSRHFQFLKEKLIPLPPLEEQKRIVAKIEELMPYVDKYDVAYSEVVKLNKKFPEDMQKSILQYAIQGNLVEQREEDGTAEDLYKQIQEEKKKLIKEGKIKKTKALPEITEDEIPFDIPENWKWVRLGDLCNYGKCNSTPAKNIPKNAWLLDLEDIEKDSGKVLNKKRMQDVKSTSSKHIFKEGDVLYSKLRPYLNKVVIADEDGYSTSEILPLDFGTHVYNRYAQTVLMSPYFINYTVKCSYGVKMPRLGTTDGQLAVFPLAPLEEQKRIVEKVYELLPYAKQLAKKIDHPAQG